MASPTNKILPEDVIFIQGRGDVQYVRFDNQTSNKRFVFKDLSTQQEFEIPEAQFYSPAAQNTFTERPGAQS